MLAREGDVLARYLIGRRPPRDARERYTAAVTLLTADGRLGRMPHPTRLCLSRPILLGPCDAWLSRLAPQHDLRRRLLLMAAILETHPETAGFFMPIDRGRVSIAWILAMAGARTALRLVLGLPLVPMLLRERHP